MATYGNNVSIKNSSTFTSGLVAVTRNLAALGTTAGANLLVTSANDAGMCTFTASITAISAGTATGYGEIGVLINGVEIPIFIFRSSSPNIYTLSEAKGTVTTIQGVLNSRYVSNQFKVGTSTTVAPYVRCAATVAGSITVNCQLVLAIETNIP